MPLFAKGADNAWHGRNGLASNGALSAIPWVKKPDNTWAQATKMYRKVATNQRTVTNKALTSNVATITTSAAHGYSVGDWVYVQISDGQFDGLVQVATVPLTTTFTYARTNANVTSAAASGTAVFTSWQEIYPLLPGDPTGLSVNALYRNDRIEADFAWAAPGSGVATAYYIVNVYINGGFYGQYNITAPTVAFTLTNVANNAAGFNNYAGQTFTFNVTSYTAGNVPGNTITSGGAGIPQLPAPPAPTSLAASLSGGDPTTSWAHGAGNRLSYFELNVGRNTGGYGGGSTYFFGAATSVSTTSNPWGGGNVNGGEVYIQVRAVGVGGASSWVQIFLRIPEDLVVVGNSSGAFVSGQFQINLANPSGGTATTVDVYWQQNGGGLNYNGNYSASFSSPIASGSSGFPRDNSTQYRFATQPRNGYGTGRLMYYGWCRKMANPFVVDAQDSASWNAGSWQGDSGGHYVFQGYAATYGFYWGYGFYGAVFNQYLGAGYNGYGCIATGITIFMGREGFTTGPYYANYAGPNALVQILFALHTAQDRNGHTESFAGTGSANDSSTNFGLDDYHSVTLPTDWGQKLIEATNGWRGIGIFSPDSTIQYLPPSGTSNSMARMYGHAYSNGDQFWRVRIYHSG